jgi:hypothetical protein
MSNRLFEPYVVEEMILSMADIVEENRWLREENDRLKDYEKKYNDLLNQSVRQANQNSFNVLQAALAGVDMARKENKED